MFEGLGLDLKLIAILGGIAMVLVELIKHFFVDKVTGVSKLGYWALLVSVGFGFVVTAIFADMTAMTWQVFIRTSVAVGFFAASVYNGTAQIGYAIAKTAVKAKIDIL